MTCNECYSPPTQTGAGHQWTIPTTHFLSWCSQWEPLDVTNVGTHRSPVTHTSKCGWAITSKSMKPDGTKNTSKWCQTCKLSRKNGVQQPLWITFKSVLYGFECMLCYVLFCFWCGCGAHQGFEMTSLECSPESVRYRCFHHSPPEYCSEWLWRGANGGMDGALGDVTKEGGAEAEGGQPRSATGVAKNDCESQRQKGWR